MAPEPRPPDEPARREDSPERRAGEDARASDPASHAAAASALTRLLAELARTPDPEAVAEVSQRRLEPGEKVGRFELLREVGRGGFGVVFEARDADLGRRVAFKAFRPGRPLDARQVEALRHEAESAAQLNHPSVVTIHDFGNCAAGPYVIMELLRGEPLSQRVEPGPLPPREALRIAHSVAQALVHAHAAGVIHRDLKPGNVFLCEDGKVKVLDFGLARLLGAGGEKGGTPGYMAPEQSRGEAEDERTDLFGLGVLLYRMLTGTLPYEVVRGRSAALDPGPTPAPEGKGIPPRLAALVQELLERDPGTRPRNALEVQDELAAIQRLLDPLHAARRRRSRLTVAAALLLGAGGLAGGLWSRFHPGGPDRITVAVADFENATGDPQLDGLSGLLITSLEQSRKLQVLTRSRMRDELRKLGRDDVDRLDEIAARQVGKATGARALLLASMRRLGGAYALELRAIDPATDEYVFTANDRAASKEEVPAAIDRLSERTRRELRERTEDVNRDKVELGQAATRNLEAYQHYFAGMECLERPGENIELECLPLFQRAVAADPDFALAHHRVALTASYLSLGGTLRGDEALVRRAVAEAVRLSGRTPAKERALILALQAHLAGDTEAAATRYRDVLARFPEDKHTQFLAARLRLDRDDYAGALPFLQRAVDLDPFFQTAVRRYVYGLGALRRTDELRSRLAAWSRLPPNPALRAAAVRGAVWLGDLDGALATAERNLDVGGLLPAFDLANVQFSRGEFRRTQATLERARTTAPDHLRLGLYRAFALEAQGRAREALAAYDALRERVARESAGEYHRARAHLLMASGDAAAVWSEAQLVSKDDAVAAGTLAADLALLGDAGHARELAAKLPPSAPDAVLAEAALTWRAGDPAAARARLKALDALDPAPEWGLPPAFLLAEVAAATGEDVEVVDAAARFRATWSHLSSRGGWTVPRMLYQEARALARLGRPAEARRLVEALLAERASADPGDRLSGDARTLLASLVPGAVPR